MFDEHWCLRSTVEHRGIECAIASGSVASCAHWLFVGFVKDRSHESHMEALNESFIPASRESMPISRHLVCFDRFPVPLYGSDNFKCLGNDYDMSCLSRMLVCYG